MTSGILELLQFCGGTDITRRPSPLNTISNRNVLNCQKVCMRNFFTTGKVDSRQSTFRKLYPLGACCYHGCHHWIQIFASISFVATRAPEDHGRSVICQVPCYSGGDTLLCSNIDSLAQVKYGWSLDLGMIVPVHRVSFSISLVQTLTLILDLSVLCLFGEGTKQHQHSIILFGLYRCAGRAVP